MRKMKLKMLSREQRVIVTIFLLLHTRGKVHSASCPDPCDCMFSDIIDDNAVTCEWENSSINITMSNVIYMEYDINSFDLMSEITRPTIYITCQGTSHPCDEDLPQFDISNNFDKTSVSLYVTSCTSDILRCYNQIVPKVTRTEKIVLDHTKDIASGILLSNSIPKLYLVDYIIKGGDFQLYPNMFKGTKVQTVEFHSNNISSIPNDTFNGAIWFSLEIINNDIEHITPAAFRGLETWILGLTENKRLKSIDPESLSGTINLKNLFLKNNPLEILPNGLLSGLISLETVLIENNLVEVRLESQVFASTSLTHVKVSNSKLVILPESLFVQSNALTHVDFGHNMIKHLPPKLFQQAIYLTHITLNDNRIQVLPERIFSGLERLRHVDLRFNNIVELTDFLFYPNVMDLVSLDYNNITVLDVGLFNIANITTLSFVSNQIKNLTTSNGRTLRVKDLNLSNNKISVYEYWPIDSTALKKLNISGNKISIIKESDLNLYNGAEIDFRYNNITNITIDSNSSLPPVTKAVSYLAHNPLDCNCPITTILKKWKADGLLLDSKEITFADGQHLSNVKLYTLCGGNDSLITIIGSSAVCALVIVVIIISLIRRRNEIWQYITYICNHNNESDLKNNQRRLDDFKPYDLFISFAHQDSELVADKLMPKLENDFGQKVCVHYRDWIVGELIPDQIIKSVESSRVTIIVLTEHFLESQWSHLEFRTAHNLGIQEGRSTIIIIVTDVSIIGNKQLPSELKSYIVTNRYLLWGDFDFWENLQQKLPRHGKKYNKRNRRS